jgi:hypothetical protein
MLTIKTSETNSLSRYSVQNIVVALFIATACVIVIVRSMSALMMNTDPSIQIGSALALLNGDGLGTYKLSEDITQPPGITPLTWFSPGFSITIFLLAQVGISTAIAIKLIYAISTIAGWYGWGLMFRDVMRSHIQTVLSKIIAMILAVLLPLYFTYDWVGTDLILWAIIPWVIRLFYSNQPPHHRNPHVSFWIGGLIGLAYTFRYAAIFLLVGFVLFSLIKWRGFRDLGRILLGFSIPYGIISLYRVSVTTSIPSQFAIENLFQVKFLLKRTVEVLAGLRQVRFLFFSHVSTLSSGGVIVGLVAVAILLLYVSILIKSKTENPRLEIILCISVGLIVFLTAISYVSSVDFVYLADHRYYYPLFPSMTLVAYELGFERRTRILKIVSLICLGGLILVATTMIMRSPEKVFGFDRYDARIALSEYPSNAIVNKDPESTEAVIKLLKKNPNAIAITFAEDFDIYHIAETSVRKRLLPASVFTASFSSNHRVGKEVQTYLVFGEDNEDCKTYCYYDSAIEVELMQQIRNPKQVYYNSSERIRVFSTQLPEGFQFTLSKQ